MSGLTKWRSLRSVVPGLLCLNRIYCLLPTAPLIQLPMLCVIVKAFVLDRCTYFVLENVPLKKVADNFFDER
jgi:hypothetical protein